MHINCKWRDFVFEATPPQPKNKNDADGHWRKIKTLLRICTYHIHLSLYFIYWKQDLQTFSFEMIKPSIQRHLGGTLCTNLLFDDPIGTTADFGCSIFCGNPSPTPCS